MANDEGYIEYVGMISTHRKELINLLIANGCLLHEIKSFRKEELDTNYKIFMYREDIIDGK